MNCYWIVHLKNGQNLSFEKKGDYVDTLNGTSHIAIMEGGY